MKLTVVGTGYVGLVSGVCFAETGNDVTCVDIDEQKVQALRAGKIPIYEPGLELLFERNLRQGRLHFTTELAPAVESADIIFLALPTPPNEDGSADLSYVEGVARQLAGLIKSYTIVVNKSTVPVGTAEKVHAILAEKLPEELFDVVSNPEFLREGVAVEDFLKPDRVVIGARSERAAEIMKRLYQPYVRQGNPILIMDLRSAEMTKYASNAYLATRISFMNEIANLCERAGADVHQVRLGMGSDSRIGKRFLFPGVGFGGSCFPKDVRALYKTAAKYQYEFRILKAVTEVNREQKLALVRKIKNFYGEDLSGKTIAIWGLAFKAETDDIREAPSLNTIDALLSAGAALRVYDPEAMKNVRQKYGRALYYATDAYDALLEADALAILTEWSAFRTPNFEVMKKLMNNPAIFDGRNLYEPRFVREKGFHYEGIGRP
ncbi:MAG TPA: UDP-glucose/GDP-mannose dehydrogenase family protein [Phaeodactylibacter sp.]|nr:UDP-glucose/GDP-mannose dehydrogenase family protein [Phaeodactylibacter sp.]